MDKKKNISLMVGLAIPILMIVLIATSIYLPSFFAPRHSLIFSTLRKIAMAKIFNLVSKMVY